MEESNNQPESLVAYTELPQVKYQRNQFGLIESIQHNLNDDGSVNWRSMIKPEFLYPNRDWFEIRKKPIPESIEDLDDKQLLIMLAGLKELAKLRGFTSVTYDVKHVSDNYVSAICRITWIGNYETSGLSVVYEDAANATFNNTDDFCLKFLESIACNRAFVRCVRNFLNIHIVGADEIDKSKNRVADISDLIVSNALPINPQGILEKAVNEKLKLQTFDEFKSFLRPLWKKSTESNDTAMLSILEEAKNWNTFKDVPAKASRVFLKVINEHKKDN